jgi:hypothetical protein
MGSLAQFQHNRSQIDALITTLSLLNLNPTMSFKKFFKPLGCITLASAFVGVSPLFAVLIQDFETDTSGITELPMTTPFSETSLSVSDIIRQADGTQPQDIIGVPPSSSGGSFYAEVRSSFVDASNNTYLIQGDRIRWNDGPKTGGFVSGLGHRMDVYFDDLAFFEANDGFYFQPAILDNTNTTPINGGGFGVRVFDLGGGSKVWRVAADGNVKGFSGNLGPTVDISTTGWYTMETIWVENLGGNVDQINTLYDISGTVVLSVTQQDLLPASFFGDLGAASFGQGDEDGTFSFGTVYAIDNLEIVPESSAFALVTGLFFLAYSVAGRRRK